MTPEGLERNDIIAWPNPPPSMTLRRTRGEIVSLENQYANQTAFLVCSGPSLNKLDLSLLNQRGIMTMGLNNSWAVHRPDFWVACDNPGRFLDAGHLDAGITKFIPCEHRDRPVRYKSNGEFYDTPFLVKDCPNVYFFQRNMRFVPETFLTEPSVNWGVCPGDGSQVDPGGSLATMLAALKLLYYLGFRLVYLLGCDFSMKNGAERNYAFEQDRTDKAVSNNMRGYEALNRRFGLLRPHFESKEFYVRNCNPQSKLKVFDFADYNDAVKASASRRSLDTEGWYNIDRNKVSKRRVCL